MYTLVCTAHYHETQLNFDKCHQEFLNTNFILTTTQPLGLAFTYRNVEMCRSRKIKNKLIPLFFRSKMIGLNTQVNYAAITQYYPFSRIGTFPFLRLQCTLSCICMVHHVHTDNQAKRKCAWCTRSHGKLLNNQSSFAAIFCALFVIQVRLSLCKY